MCRGHHRGREGFPTRERLVDRLQGYQEHLQKELENVQDLLKRLSEPAQ